MQSSITDKICSVCNDLDLSMNEKMCGFGSDETRTMIGSRNGVAAKLKEKVPWLVNNHCVAHRLQLWPLDLGTLDNISMRSKKM